jgi:hypothetical protein
VSGQLGLGDMDSSMVPKKTPKEVAEILHLDKNRIVQLSVGGQHSVLLVAKKTEMEEAKSRKATTASVTRRKTMDPSKEEHAKSRKRKAASPGIGPGPGSEKKSKSIKRRKDEEE